MPRTGHTQAGACLSIIIRCVCFCDKRQCHPSKKTPFGQNEMKKSVRKSLRNSSLVQGTRSHSLSRMTKNFARRLSRTCERARTHTRTRRETVHPRWDSQSIRAGISSRNGLKWSKKKKGGTTGTANLQKRHEKRIK